MSDRAYIPIIPSVVEEVAAAITASVLPPALKEHLLKPGKVNTPNGEVDSQVFVQLFYIVVANGRWTVSGWGCIDHGGGPFQRGLEQTDALYLIAAGGFVDGCISSVHSPITARAQWGALFKVLDELVGVYFDKMNAYATEPVSQPSASPDTPAGPT